MNKLKRFFQISRAGRLIFKEIQKAKQDDKDFKKCGPAINQILTDLGPIFIKLGQMLSLRPDLIPADLADEMRNLLDTGTAVSFEEVKTIFKKELKTSPDKLFDSFSKKPFAVASLAQVHQASHKNKELAVKVQKPDIKEVIKVDLKLARMILLVPCLSPRMKRAKRLVKTMLSELFKWIECELDYRLEALNMSRIKENFAKVKYFVAPEVFYQFSSQKILTMGYIEGVSLNELFDNVSNLDRKKVISYKNIKIRKDVFVKQAISIIFKQIWEDGYFHADPHPANVLITPQGKIAYIDFGVIGVLQPRFRKVLLEVFSGIIDQDVAKIARSFVALDEIQGCDSLSEIQAKIRTLLNDWQSGTIIEASTAEIFYRLLIIALESKVELPLGFIVVGKTILGYDGNLRKLEPELSIVDSFRPHVEKAQGIKSFPDKLIPTSVKELLERADDFSQGIRSLLKKVAEDGIEFTVRFGPKDKSQSR